MSQGERTARRGRRWPSDGRPTPEKPFDGAVSRYVEEGRAEGDPQGARGRRQGRHPRPALSLPEAARRRRLRGGLRRLPARARQAADLVARHRPAHRRRLRGPRRRRQGRHDPAPSPRTSTPAPPAASRCRRPPTSSAASGTSSATSRTCRPAGEMVLFDRSWYNRAVVEHVFGWCTAAERARFFAQLPEFEDMLVHDGIILIKIWLAIGRAEQLRQFLQRERDPAEAVEAQPDRHRRPRALGRLHRRDRRDVRRQPPHRRALDGDLGEDKRRARLAAMQSVLARLDYPGKTVEPPDPKICGGPDIARSRGVILAPPAPRRSPSQRRRP